MRILGREMSKSDQENGLNKSEVRLSPSGSKGARKFVEALTEEELRALKALKQEEPELCEGQSDSFLMKFIWARKLDIRRAAEVLRDHMVWRKEWDMENLDIKAIEAYLKSGVSTWVPGLYSREGYSATFIVPRKLDLATWRKFGSRGMMHAIYYVTDMASDHDIDIARQGTVMVLDFSGASWSDIISAIKGDGQFDLSKIMDSTQNHMPSRVRDIILLNPPWWIRLLLGTIKPLLKAKLRRKIHSAKTSELGDYFTPENIISEWGGRRVFDLDHWAETILHARPTLSEGKYVDPATRSDETIRLYTGTQSIGTKHGTAPVAKSLSTLGKLEAQ